MYLTVRSIVLAAMVALLGAAFPSLAAAAFPNCAPGASVVGFQLSPGSATAGVQTTFTATAEGNGPCIVSDYTDVVSLRSTDTGATLPASFAVTNGVGSFQGTFDKADLGEILFMGSADANAQNVDAIAPLPVMPGPATHFSVSAPATVVSYTTISLTVTALDQYGNTATGYTGTVHLTSTDPSFLNATGDQTLNGGVGTFGFGLKQAGTQTVTATDTVDPSITGGADITVVPGPVDHFTVSAPSTVSTGTQFNVTVTARDLYGNTVTGYTGTVHFTGSDAAATLPADTTLTSGVGTFSATLATPGPGATITAADTANNAITGTSAGILAIGPTTQLVIATGGVASRTAGQSLPFTIEAEDAAGDVTPGYAGTVHFTSTDGQALLPADTTLMNGAASVSATFKTAGAQTITATDASSTSITGTSPDVTVSPGPATHFSVTAGNGATAGAQLTVTVTALDQFDNPATGYTGTAHFTSSDGQALLPGDTTLTNGVGTVQVTLKTAGAQTVTAVDSTTSSITGTSNPITIFPASPAGFTVAAPASAVAGVPVSFSVSAHDQFGNLSQYAGTITFSSTDSAASLPTSRALTNGESFAVTFKTAGIQTVTVTRASAPAPAYTFGSISGTSGNIVVAPGPATHFKVTAPASATVGSSFQYAVTALDAEGNTATGYAGTVHFTSTDGAATLTADAALTAGTGSFSATLNTAGSQTITATDAANPSITSTSGPIAVSARPVPPAPVIRPAPVITIVSPGDGTTYDRMQVVNASYSCKAAAGGPAITSCNGTTESGAELNTQTHGTHTFTVTAVTTDGARATKTVTYRVVWPDNNFTVTHLRAYRDGDLTFDVRVPSRGSLTVLETAWADNLAIAARNAPGILEPANRRDVYARASANPSRAGTVHFVVTPSAHGRRLLAHPSYRITLRLWVSYIPYGGRIRSRGFLGVHLGPAEAPPSSAAS